MPRGGRRIPGPGKRLGRLAGRENRTPADVEAYMERQKIPTKELVRLYFGERLSCRTVGERAGMTGTAVHRRLACAGYRLRPARRAAGLTPKVILRPGSPFWHVEALIDGKRLRINSRSTKRRDAEDLLQRVLKGSIPPRRRRTPGQGHICRAKGGRFWRIVMRVNGRRYSRSTRTTDRIEAERQLDQWIANPSRIPAGYPGYGQGRVLRSGQGCPWHIRWGVNGVVYRISSRTTNYDKAQSLLRLVTSQQLTPPLSPEVWTSIVGARYCKRPGCGGTISPLLPAKLEYCNDRCRLEAERLRKGGRPSVEKVCEACGKAFVTTYPNKRYCDVSCNNLAYSRKQPARLAVNGTEPKSQKLGGRPKGMSKKRMSQALELERYIQEFAARKGTKKGAIPHAARKVYGYDSRKAVQQASQTLKEFRKTVRKPS